MKNLNWQDDANCKGMDFNLFFELYEQSNETQLMVDDVCSSCNVQSSCRAWAEEEGFEGGVFGRKYFPVKVSVPRKRELV